MEETTRGQNSPDGPDSPPKPPQEDLIKVVDRKGNVKVIARSEYEEKTRRRRKREPRKTFPYRDILSLALIVVIMIIAIYIALKIVQ